ncbi:MAG: P-loop NTPase fold protein [Spirochaetota bacterium]
MILNDKWTLADDIQHGKYVKEVTNIIQSCEPPYVLGIHGDWGSGKTSFLRKMHWYLAGSETGYESPISYREKWGKDFQEDSQLETIWFDAWHYSFEDTPAVALLNEIRSHFTLKQRFSMNAKKFAYTALMTLDDLMGKLKSFSIAENAESALNKWDKKYHTQPLPSQMIKVLMEKSIDTLLNADKDDDTADNAPKKRLVIFVDDLDRCNGPVAFKLLEALKIYFSIDNCVFVIGMDVRHVRRAVAAELKIKGMIPATENVEIYAADYLNKMFQYVFYLPVIPNYKEYLKILMQQSELKADLEIWIDRIEYFKLLPLNPRKIKSFIGSLSFFVKRLLTHNPNLEIDIQLTLIVLYLKLYANEVFRILKEEYDFWDKLILYCRKLETSDIKALEKLTHPQKVKSLEGEGDVQLESAFHDPAYEGLFRATRLIADYGRPAKDKHSIYLV